MIIYLITNKITGKRYIGQSVNTLKHRWNQHVSHSKNPKRSGILCSAIRKYGRQNFQIKVLSKCESIEEMNHRETYYIRLFNTLTPYGYNLDSGGKNKMVHEETRKKQSLALIGKKRGPFTEEHKKNLSNAHIGKKYGPMSEERKLKISIANSGERGPNFGKKMPDHVKSAVSRANKNNRYWLGKKHTSNAKEKISKSKDSLKKRVFCLNNGITYDSKHAASRDLKVGRKEIGKNISGEISHVKGFIFKKA